MHAMRYHGPGRHSWDEVPDATLQEDGDVVVRVDAVTICGTDLHILKGDVPTVEPGRTLGHEAVGTVVEAGSGVRTVAAGDRVLVSCISACGTCGYCRQQRYGQCTGGGGWILGHRVDGVQAELVRVPFADRSVYKLPDGVSDERALMLADIIPTSYEVGVLNGALQPGQSVVVVGAGPIGLAAVLTARLFSPALVIVADIADQRLQAAKSLGADVTVNTSTTSLPDAVRELTDGLGADLAIEAVGIPETFEVCADLVRPGGRVANVGVHGKPATLHLERFWISDLTITTGLVDTYSTPTLLRLVQTGQVDTSPFVTHHFSMRDEFMLAYDVFGRAAETGALKVMLTR